MDNTDKCGEKAALDGLDDDMVPDASGAWRPELPPGLVMANSKTTEEVFQELNKHPFFMTELQEDNEYIEALQALAYEGTPLENAAGFKEQGNECFREKKYGDAKVFYGKGIDILVAEERRRRRDEGEATTDEDTVSQERGLLEQLYVNRAACQLELGNYGSCTVDCAGALRLNPRNVKALYRSGKALLALGRTADADDACERGQQVDSGNASLRLLASAIAARRGVDRAKAKREADEAAVARRRQMLLWAALRARGIRTRRTKDVQKVAELARGNGGDAPRVQLLPDPDAPTSALSFPVLLLYPCHLETDFIRAVDERETLGQHFGYVFPLPWDREGAYAPTTVECFVETAAGGVVKVGRRVPLLELLTKANCDVVDDVVKVFVVPRARADAWLREFKAGQAGVRASSL